MSKDVGDANRRAAVMCLSTSGHKLQKGGLIFVA